MSPFKETSLKLNNQGFNKNLNFLGVSGLLFANIVRLHSPKPKPQMLNYNPNIARIWHSYLLIHEACLIMSDRLNETYLFFLSLFCNLNSHLVTQGTESTSGSLRILKRDFNVTPVKLNYPLFNTFYQLVYY